MKGGYDWRVQGASPKKILNTQEHTKESLILYYSVKVGTFIMNPFFNYQREKLD